MPTAKISASSWMRLSIHARRRETAGDTHGSNRSNRCSDFDCLASRALRGLALLWAQRLNSEHGFAPNRVDVGFERQAPKQPVQRCRIGFLGQRSNYPGFSSAMCRVRLLLARCRKKPRWEVSADTLAVRTPCVPGSYTCPRLLHFSRGVEKSLAGEASSDTLAVGTPCVPGFYVPGFYISRAV